MKKDDLPCVLGGISPQEFMRVYWQKKPLLIRQAIPGMQALLSRKELFELASEQDVESRLVSGDGDAQPWQMRNGPFKPRALPSVSRPNWTLLVQGVDLHVDAFADLRDRFRFIPDARLDDVMVSYAAPGGGVGPHFDSYDVFLLQGAGTRRWQFGRQRDLSLIDGVPLKILKRFGAQHDLVMQSGDLLYLPPHYAHNGTALGACLTWSIGMRAPTQREVASQFLDYLQDRLQVGNVYRDPGLKQRRHPAAISAQMRDVLRGMIKSIRWSNADIDRYLGEMLSEPRQSVVFDPPSRMSGAAFAQKADQRGLQLDLRTRLLFDRKAFFINGESIVVTSTDARILRTLADERALAAGTHLSRTALALLQEWHAAGFVRFGESAPQPAAKQSNRRPAAARARR